MKYAWFIIVLLPVSVFAQDVGEWYKVTVPGQSDSADYISTRQNIDKVLFMSKKQEIYVYEDSKGLSYQGSSDVNLKRFMAKREIAHVFSAGENLWFQMYYRGFMSRGHYDDILFYDEQKGRAKDAKGVDRLFRGVDRLTGTFYAPSKDILVMSTLCSGLLLRSNAGFRKIATFNSALMDNCLNALAVDAQGHIWLASQTAGLLEYNLRTDECRSFNTDNSVVASNYIRNVKIGGANQVYFSDGAGGLYRQNDKGLTLINAILDAEKQTVPLAYSPDSEGKLWLYAASDTVYRVAAFDKQNAYTELPAEDYPFEPSQYAVHAIYALRSELLLFTDGGLFVYRFAE